MSPPITTPHPDCPSTQNFKFSEKFDFSAGSIDGAGFNHSKSGDGKSNVSSRSRPRLTKMRRKQMTASRDGKSVKTGIGLNGFSDVSGEIKLDDILRSVCGDDNRNSMSNGFANNGDLNGNKEQVGNGSEFGIDLNDSLSGLGVGNGESLFGSSLNGSTSNLQSKEGASVFFASSKGGPNTEAKTETGSFVFGSDSGGSNLGEKKETVNQNLPDGCAVFGLNKSGLPVNPNFGNEQFVFGVSDINAKDSRGFKARSKVHGIKKSDNVNSNKDIGNTVPDVRGKVKMDTPGDSEKVGNPCSQFPFNWSGESSKNNLNFVFGSNSNDTKVGIDLGNKTSGKNKGMSNSTESGEENVDIGIPFQNANLNGVFVFGGLKDKGGFRQHSHNTPDINSKCQNSSSSGGFSEKGPAFSISDEMRRLNISVSEVDPKKTERLTSNFSVNSNSAFVFGRDQKDSGLKNENHPINMTENKSEPNGTSPSMFPSVGMGIQLNGGFCGVPHVNKDEKDSISFTSRQAGLDSSDAGCSTPNMTFTFSNYNSCPVVNKRLDNANSKSLGGKRLKKKNGKLNQRAVVQQLFGQDRVSKESSSLQNEKSPGCGSPMDFSPYQNTNASTAPEADTSIGVKGEFAVDKKDISEKPHDDEHNSNFSPSLPAQDGLSAVRRQYRKKYKLKVGSNHTDQGNNSDKENAKQDTVPTAAHEVCEKWRIRGNQAYHDGKLSKAEEFYSMGIDFAPHISTSGHSVKPLLLCYSNRAATRMSLGRMREAIGDCTKAAELDPNFPKVTLRAGNCYLVLGEVEDAIQCYSKCLSLGTDVCLDRRITIEAADGVQKAKRVAEYMHQSAKLLQEGTDDAASNALENIEDALSISRFSERLLQMKGEALCRLRMYNEVIQLCERTLDIAKKNFGADHLDDASCKTSNVNLWRWHLQAKSHFHLGRLDLALDLIEKREKMPTCSRPGDMTQESAVALAATMRELLSLKKSGNEAYNSGRYTEAIENYTAAISKSFESRPFMSICFCNRAAAYQSVNQIVDAIADCSLAIALDENYQKAISRRATLHEMIRDYKHAVNDLQRLISLLESETQTKAQQSNSQSRTNGGSVRDLRKARRRLSSIEEKAKKEIPLDLYLILGIKASDAESEIKKAYRKAALRHHPDKVLVRSDVGDYGTLWKDFGEKIHNDADRLFKIIGEAYAVLSDPSKRSKYDNEEEIRNIYRDRDSNRNSNSGCPSTSYSSPYDRGNWFGRQASYTTSSERNNRRYYWHEPRSYTSNSHSRW